MPTYARPGECIKTLDGCLIYIVSNDLHRYLPDGGEYHPMISWDSFDIEGHYVLAEEAVVTRILEKYGTR